MTIDTDDLLNSIIESFGKMTYIKPEDIPNIDLYMDQVTAFLDEQLKSTSRDKNHDERLMTKTMINNYAKNDVIPPPIKKKYNKDHMLILIIIYYYKSILQINDIKDLIKPITEKYFDSNGEYGIEDVYSEIFDSMPEKLHSVTEDVISTYKESQDTFENAPEEDRDYLRLFNFVCTLGTDVFVKKLLIEKIVDSLREHREACQNKYDITIDKKAEKEALRAEKEAMKAAKAGSEILME